ncbi:oligopeptide:H+ symporter [Trinickia caryophylli]|uniref:Proton-dependent oligopeptide transporter, POT family n=1 Tax=Trinickia caryophylli TaxID=28094 RepID=A0A1X7GYG3_TRICW|nr:oligopeptide:H+ symporter [Trinickia caryophylli]PMS10114.1 MFS transporter [Trinickia caryophylli]TRX18215.1 MFS transporter [Trinickia caryophylli]WQE10997.1 oligopeptide:H+ symporter [Trinickia caryophylli]SMF76746.1 proton-dependent oligopeptide transporter, POT family [Trinickia caryophylli]GLU35388.1 POT-family proton dependent transporter [Trinickia caryophylli]
MSQTKSFVTVFLIEMWERFGFYGMAALLVLFMVERAGFTDAEANLVWGAFTALVYAAPSIGGWLGDKLIGTRRTMLLGAFVLVIGYFMLAVPDDDLSFLYASLGVIVVGNGLFKANSASLVRRIYEGDDARIDSAFTLYYMAVNIGSTVSMLATPWIKDRWGWHAAFAVCGAGMALGVANFLVRYRSLAHVGSTSDAGPIVWRRIGAVAAGGAACAAASTFVLAHEQLAVACVYAAAFAVLAIFAYMFVKCERGERAGLIAAFVLVLQTILFFVFYQQMSTSLTLFALRNVDLSFSLAGFRLFDWSAAQFQALNPIWIMVLSPLLAFAYTHRARRSADLSVAAKFAVGFVAVAAGYFIYALGGRYATDGRVSSWFMVWGYGLNALGELLVSGLGLAMIARYTPARMSGFMMGAYFVATGVSQYLGSVVANFARLPAAGVPAAQSLPVYVKLFTELGWLATAGAAATIALLPFMRRLADRHRQAVSATPQASMFAATGE